MNKRLINNGFFSLGSFILKINWRQLLICAKYEKKDKNKLRYNGMSYVTKKKVSVDYYAIRHNFCEFVDEKKLWGNLVYVEKNGFRRYSCIFFVDSNRINILLWDIFNHLQGKNI